jgi:hypothetical protein
MQQRARRSAQPLSVMQATRNSLVALGLVGLAFAMWYARPGEPGELTGWLFSLLVSSGWLVAIVICIVTSRHGRPFIGIGTLVVLSISELLIYLRVNDPWFLLFKPFLQVFSAALGAFIGFPFDRAAKTPNTSLDRMRER